MNRATTEAGLLSDQSWFTVIDKLPEAASERWQLPGASAPEADAVIETHFRRLPFGEWHWPTYPTQFYGSADVIVVTNRVECDDYSWIWLVARTEEAYRDAMKLLHGKGVDRQVWPEE